MGTQPPHWHPERRHRVVDDGIGQVRQAGRSLDREDAAICLFEQRPGGELGRCRLVNHRPRASKLDRREGNRVECGGHRQQRVHACHRCKYRRNRVDLGVAVDHNAVDQVAGLSDQFGERDRLRDGGDSLERRGLPAW